MEELDTFFAQHISEAFLIYGFSGLGLAIAVAIQPRSSKSNFEKHLWLIGLFGLLIGSKQLVDWTRFSYPEINPFAIAWTCDLLLVGSYLSIFFFGWNSSLSLCPFKGVARRWFAAGFFLALGTFVTWAILAASEPRLGLRVGMRFAFGIPGFLMTALALFDFVRQERADPDFRFGSRLATATAAACFFLYGIFALASERAGVPVLDWFPDPLTVESAIIIPVRIARALLLLTITLCLGFLLRDLNTISRIRKQQVQDELKRLSDQLSEIVMERTKALQLANDELERQLAVRQRTEAELRESEARFRLTLAVTRQGLFDANLLTGVTTVSPEYATILGHDPKHFVETTENWNERTHPDDRARVAREFDEHIRGNRAFFQMEFRQRTPAGDWRWILSRAGVMQHDGEGKAVRVLGTITDITERRGMDQRLLRTERLESIGALAGGIAHDFNNALVPIVAGVTMLRPTAAKEDLVLIDAMEAGASRATAMVRQLLNFARGTGGKKGSVSVQALLSEMEKLMQSTFPKNIQLHVLCHNPESIILGDSTQIHQVLLNLCVNARDAMPAGGMLAIESSDITIDTATAAGHHNVRSGPHARIIISDTGSGIPPEVMKNIFKPFFTTKGPEKGTGLGLATAEEIVRSHNGFIELRTETGKGTRFIVYFPLKPATDAANDSSRSVEADMPLPDGAGRRILIVDDESMIADIVRLLLRGSGYSFETARNGVEALAWLDEHKGDYAMILFDVNMPIMDGLEFLRIAKSRYPQTPAIAMSGNLTQRHHLALAGLGIHTTLAKPFDRQSLIAAMCRALKEE